ncbi:S1-like domain-containing RNA-binding protein [Chryseobacterium arthrosphaerae]|uniref:RNA-binding protein n=1 Tax=Chryseobacterium arthrosphaerae TaxID=651561 RepID=A0A1B8ZRD9_9FLAO|nr:S1-like domain-containing RNA-binding protein [Chryseobacterium arthrosphaerae]MDG4651282.1 S1-like domain-containing RNA-binding protein [Chryseobacterium arthrosphaerae]OCA74147.1 RNA-binding protein [Chryseobacterium arthrosphaerae]RTZ46462.1 RNA-binding protein [Chryseobacterium arthrosphaerae]UEQ77644.1 RNA-binding protein [Chryseobacterium arthrosphaerae]WES99192.1 S1-like domain-containing RNA-binding protein [Chryseobacterium arthrosphaerae]
MQLGKTQTLQISEKINSGWILTDEESGEKAFLPKIFIREEQEVGEYVEVFVYQDDDKLKATTEIPLAEVGEFAVMSCVQSLPSGAFMDWGIIKDLFIPYKQQKAKIIEGKRYLVYIYVDEDMGLITGTTKFKRNPQYQDLPFRKGDKVDLIMMNEGELGWNVVINKQYIGLIYASDVFKKLYPLSEEKGYIKAIREDGKIDVSLQPDGFENIDEFKQKILDKLEENYGLLYVSDKSSPEEIKDELQMSKKNFKKAIGGLYKDKIIDILEDKIKLL